MKNIQSPLQIKGLILWLDAESVINGYMLNKARPITLWRKLKHWILLSDKDSSKIERGM